LSEEHRNKGNEHFKNSNFAEAIKEYEEAVKRNPNDVRPHNNLASCFIKLMRYDAALTEVEKCLGIDSENLKA
jgi:stress-induced-phosphoprotein 1